MKLHCKMRVLLCQFLLALILSTRKSEINHNLVGLFRDSYCGEERQNYPLLSKTHLDYARNLKFDA